MNGFTDSLKLASDCSLNINEMFLGDPVQGVIMGSVLELMFIGSFPIGAAVSPDYTSAGAICTAFAILTGGGRQ